MIMPWNKEKGRFTGQWFSLDYGYHNGGGSSPFDTFQQAIDYFDTVRIRHLGRDDEIKTAEVREMFDMKEVNVTKIFPQKFEQLRLF